MPAEPGARAVALMWRVLDRTCRRGVSDGVAPGVVVLVGNSRELLFHGAYGSRALVPTRLPMLPGTVFDVASLTKPIATTTAMMLLVRDGRVRLDDPVSAAVPEFGDGAKSAVTFRQLLNHTSGLPAWKPYYETVEKGGNDAVGRGHAFARVHAEPLAAAPGEKACYSDLGFILLGEVVERVTGARLDRFCRDEIFAPLGLSSTFFVELNRSAHRARPAAVHTLAATEDCPWRGRILCGEVHDDNAFAMGGVAGHAGLFATARDLARFCAMLLGGGARDGVRLLAPLTVARMTRVSTPPHLADRRGLGWDIDSRYSSNRGDLFAVGSYGHTGFTGTSLWIDPASETFVVFLSSRVHPAGGGNVTALRGQVATVVASALRDAPAPPRGPVWTGVDVLREEGFRRLSGRRVGLLTNRTGRARDGASTIDLLAEASGVELVALFSPEHGIRGELDGPVPSGRDARTGLPVHSLYGERRRPSAAMLRGLDTVVVDLQDAGARFYTYATTVAYVLEAAARRGLRVVVLDRPNPIGGTAVEGPRLDRESLGFTGYFPAPVRHGLTLGELARLFNGEREIGADLEVVPMRGWARAHWFDETGLTWVDPSPNLRNLHQAVLYPGIGAIEGANLSVGRGTDTPFEQIGAPWIDGPALARELDRAGLPGLRVYPVSFTPESSRFAGELCHGVFFLVTDRDALRPVRLGLEVAAALRWLHGDAFDLDAVARLFGSRAMLDRIRAGDPTWQIAAGWDDGAAAWRRLSAPYLLYE